MECLELEKNEKESVKFEQRISNKNIIFYMGLVESKLRRGKFLKSSEDLVYTQNAIYVRQKSGGGLTDQLTGFGNTREVFEGIFAVDKVLTFMGMRT